MEVACISPSRTKHPSKGLIHNMALPHAFSYTIIARDFPNVKHEFLGNSSHAAVSAFIIKHSGADDCQDKDGYGVVDHNTSVIINTIAMAMNMVIIKAMKNRITFISFSLDGACDLLVSACACTPNTRYAQAGTWL